MLPQALLRSDVCFEYFSLGVLTDVVVDIPDVPGLDDFKGQVCHSSFWQVKGKEEEEPRRNADFQLCRPAEGIDYKDKRVAIIGTGASGVQMIQEMTPTAAQVTVYQRTPNLSLPMGRRDLTREEQDAQKPMYPTIHEAREHCFAGFHYDLLERNTFDDSPEERREHFEKLWKAAGFHLWLAGYKVSHFL